MWEATGVTYYPLCSILEAGHDCWSERSRRVHARAGKVNCKEVADEDCQADADGCEGGGDVLFDSEHQHRYAKARSDERLDEDTLGRVNPRC